jgi:DNA polymerase-1
VEDGVKNGKLLLIDGHGLAFRGFYAVPETNAPDGTPTNAVLGFMNMLLKAMELWRPDGVGLFFDPHGPTARDELYGAYKEGRQPAPEGFKTQMPLIVELVKALGYPVFIEDGVEADDLIAATAASIAEGGGEALILSADKDLLQILSPGTKMARPSKGITEFKLYSEESFTEEYGFPPKAMADYLALVGDSVDNIPGVPGIGDKTARALLARHGSLDAIYDALASLPEGQRKKLESGRESAYMSYSLVIPQAVKAYPVRLLERGPADVEAAYALCERLGLKRLIARLGLASGKSPEHGAQISAATVSGAASPAGEFVPGNAGGLEIFSEKTLILADNPDVLATAGGCWAELSDGAREAFSGWLGDPDGKRLILADYGARRQRAPVLDEHPQIIRDVELAHYYLHPDAKSHALADILGERPKTGEALAGQLWALWQGLSGDPRASGLESVTSVIDAPLVPVLATLGKNGVRVDLAALRELEGELREHIAETEREIFGAAGGAINLNSPKQVGELLFERLRLPVIKKTKTGYSTDVGVLEELSRLPEPLCVIPSKMLDFRECSKMSSGFVQPFIKHAESSPDGRIRSTFLHDVTGTGRLASRDPNVQNLPVFGDWAVKFRRAITPGSGGAPRVFVAADYSQIELRVLAHLSGEERLLEAFGNDRDIHLETASWVFDLPAEEITPEQRRFAKTVNFGLIYGMGAHGLASRMGITRFQAAGLIERYFSVLPRVRRYLEMSAREARSRGYTLSVLGRIRPLSEVSTVEGRGGGSIDRVAVNTPIQSTAADIAKIALIRFQRIIGRDHPDTLLVLQVHDSLICETPAEKAGAMEAILVETMENVKYIDVPLKAESKRGRSLAEV